MKNHLFKYLPVFLLALVLILTIGFLRPVEAQDQQSKIFVIREAIAKDGKMAEAIRFAREIADFVNHKFPDRNMRIYLETFGVVNKIYFVKEHKDLATLEMEQRKLMADQGYHALLAKSAGLFIEGKIKDTLMRPLMRPIR